MFGNALSMLPVVAACLGAALVAGAFFAFSTFIMGALARLPTAAGIAAMQSINLVVINVWFMAALFGTGLLALIAGGAALLGNPLGAGGTWTVAGALLYLVGTLGVTIACNVPRNDRLAALTPTAPDAEAIWRRFVREWTFWNHVRTVAALGAAGSFLRALLT